MKLRIEVDGEGYTLELERDGSESRYSLEGAANAHGSVSVAELRPGIFSVLLGYSSFTVYLSEKDGSLEVSTGTERHLISIVDARDRWAGNKKIAPAGPAEIRALMPGKVIKLLVAAGATVQAGQGVIVVEAMKMQNEMKSPKDGVISHIRVQEGATVSPGETLMVVD